MLHRHVGSERSSARDRPQLRQLGLQADIDLAGFLGIDDAVRPGIQAIRVDVTLDSDATREEGEELIRVVTQRLPIRDTLVAGTAIETVLV